MSTVSAQADDIQATTKYAYYAKYPWAAQVFGISSTGASADFISSAQWQAAGFPTVYTVGWIPGSRVYRFLSNPAEIFVDVPSSSGHHLDGHHLNSAEWAAMGRRAPQVVPMGFIQYKGVAAIYAVEGCKQPAYATVHLTQPTWQSYGFPTPTILIAGQTMRCYPQP